MNAFRALRAATLLPLILPQVAAAVEPIVLTPASKWSIRYDENQCVLSRSFGSGEQGIVLEFVRVEPGDRFNFRGFGKVFDGAASAKRTFEVAFGDSPAHEVQATTLKATLGAETLPGLDFGYFTLAGPWIYSDVPTWAPIAPEQEGAVRTLVLSPLPSQKFRVELGAMGPPMAEMRKCTDSLIRHWGYDPAAFAGLKRRAQVVGNKGRWVTTADIPRELLNYGFLATVRLRLDIDGSGGVMNCTPLDILGNGAFGPLTCELVMRRARFSPASDLNGMPVNDFYIERVRWVGPPG